MQHQASLLTLPVDVPQQNVCSFLEVHSLAHLDSAICQWEARAHYLQSVKAHQLNDIFFVFPCGWDWLILRKMTFSKCALLHDAESIPFEKYRSLFETLRWLSTPFSLAETTFHNYVDVIKPNMLHYLCFCSPTCAWNESTLLHFLTRQANLRTAHLHDDDFITDQTLHHIALTNRQLVCLGLDCRKVHFCDSAVSALLVACRLLEELRLHGSSVKDSTLALVGKHCKLLQTIFLWRCSAVTNVGLLAMAKGCPNIRSIWLNTCDSITAPGIASIGKYCTQLRRFTCNSELLGSDVVSFFDYVKELRKLNASFGSEVVERAAVNWRHLTHLQLTRCNVTEKAIEAMIQNCTCLRSLQLYGVSQLTDDLLKSWAVHAPGLKDVWLTTCALITDDGVTAFFETCRHISFFSLHGSNHVTYMSALMAARKTLCRYSFEFPDCAHVTRYDEYNAWLTAQNERIMRSSD